MKGKNKKMNRVRKTRLGAETKMGRVKLRVQCARCRKPQMLQTFIEIIRRLR